MTREEMASSRTHDSELLLQDQIDLVMSVGIEQGIFPGGVVLVRHRNEVVLHEAYGYSLTHLDAQTLSSEPVVTSRDTTYDLASITKVFTATCVMQLVDEGKVRLDDTLVTLLPEFGAGSKPEITVRQLLAHTSGLPRLQLWEQASTYDARVEKILALTPEVTPGSRFEYSDVNYLVLGELLERIDGRPLDQVVGTRVVDLLGLRQTRFGPLSVRTANVAATEDESSVGRGMVHGEVHDENAWSLGGIAGHAGLFGTAQDVSVFGQVYLNGGTFAGAKLLNSETVAEMTRNQVGDLDRRGLGWQLNAPYYMSDIAAARAYGHTGFTGTSIVIEPSRQLVVVLLTNRVHPTRHGPNVDSVRRAVADAVLTAIEPA